MMMDVYAAQKAAVAASDANGYAIPPLAFNRFFLLMGVRQEISEKYFT